MDASENDSTDRPVREQLRKTTIAAEGEQSQAKLDNPVHHDRNTPAVRGLNKKRSFEDVDGASTTSNNADGKSSNARHHTRKRSRDSAADEEDERAGGKRTSHDLVRDGAANTARANGAAPALGSRSATPDVKDSDAAVKEAEADMTSPKVKRSRVQEGTADGAASASTEQGPITANGGAPQETEAVKDLPQTSQSAFAASGFSALASSTSSGFGALGKSSGGFGSGGGFASPSKGSTSSLFGKELSRKDSPAEAESVSTPSAFGGALGAQSAFLSASKGSSNTFGGGFGKSGSGFGTLGGSGQLTSFASKAGSASSAPLSNATKPSNAKPFGAPDADDDVAPDPDQDDESDRNADESGIRSPVSVGTQEDKKDNRFYEQKVETGEENEEVVYQCRAKLYNFATNAAGKKEWKERGFGVLKLNVSRSAEASNAADQDPGQSDKTDQSIAARFLMRADGSHRVLLNSPIKKELKIGSAQGGAPTNGQMAFMGTIDGKSTLEALQLKVKPQSALELYDKIIELQQDM